MPPLSREPVRYHPGELRLRPRRGLDVAIVDNAGCTLRRGRRRGGDLGAWQQRRGRLLRPATGLAGDVLRPRSTARTFRGCVPEIWAAWSVASCTSPADTRTSWSRTKASNTPPRTWNTPSSSCTSSRCIPADARRSDTTTASRERLVIVQEIKKYQSRRLGRRGRPHRGCGGGGAGDAARRRCVMVQRWQHSADDQRQDPPR